MKFLGFFRNTVVTESKNSRKEKTNSAGWKRRAAICLFPAIPAVLLRIISRTVPGFADRYTELVNPLMVSTIGRVSGIFPFSLFEVLLIVLAGYVIYCGLGLIKLLVNLLCSRFIKPDAGSFPEASDLSPKADGKAAGTKSCPLLRHLRFLLLIAAVLFLLFEVSEDVYFARTRFARRYGLERTQYSNDELYEVCLWLIDEINKTAPLVLRDEKSIMQVSPGLQDRVRGAMKALGEEYPELSGFYPRPKPVFFSRLLSRVDITGVYSMFTIEANYNRDIPPYNLPFTLAHELSHLKGCESEKEANFLGVLSCIRSSDPDLHYSGAMLGWVYCGNEMIRRDKQKWKELSERICPKAEGDLIDNNRYWDQFEGKASETMHDINDAYLKAEGLAEGYASYDLVTDMIVAWRLMETAGGK